MQLHQIPKRNKRKYSAKRIGRGYGSGVGGHTVGKGQKGQRSRSGGVKAVGFEGGNVPLYRRLPKFRGFKNPNRVEYQPINLSDLESHYEKGETVSLSSLRAKGLVRKQTRQVKILAKGSLTKALEYVNVALSVSARKIVEEAGGKVRTE